MPSYYNSTPNRDWSNCTRCKLHTTRRNVVVRRSGYIANGNITHIAIINNTTTPPTPEIKRHVLFIGEAPGSLEDTLGLAFWGASGRILDKILKESCQPSPTLPSISYHFTITNAVSCRPSHTPATTTKANLWGNNRTPSEEEIKSCRPKLQEMLPGHTHIICLGEIANQAYIACGYHLPHLHVLHPSFILRQDYIALPIIEVAEKIYKWIVSQ